MDRNAARALVEAGSSQPLAGHFEAVGDRVVCAGLAVNASTGSFQVSMGGAKPPRNPSPGQVWSDPVSGMDFCWCPPGSFNMGPNGIDTGEKPLHQVGISLGFWLGRTEVTQGLWQAVMENNSSHFKGEDLPVEQVHWEDSQAFIRALNAKGSDCR